MDNPKNNEYIRDCFSEKPFVATCHPGTWFNEEIGFFTCVVGNRGEGNIYRCFFNKKDFISCHFAADKVLYFGENREHEPEEKGRGFVVFFLETCSRYSYINDIKILYKNYYERVKTCNYSWLYDDDFHEQLLEDENEHYLYTKERLFPFFDEEAREILTKFTRKFFKYAQQQGCVGEFVEDIKEKKIELPEWYKTINSIFYLFTSNGYIDEKYITIIGDTILDYTLNYKIRYKYDEIVRMTKGTNFQYAYYMMSTCYNVIYPEIENKENRLNWCIMCARLFDKKEDTWYKHWNDNSEVDGNFQKKIRVILSNR